MPKPSIVYQKVFPKDEAHSFSLDAFDDLITYQGLPLIHYRGMVCPLGVQDVNDQSRRIHEDHDDCKNGVLYRRRGVVMALVPSMSTQAQQQDFGVSDGTQGQATFSRHYEDGTEVLMRPFDRLYLNDETILVTHQEQVQYRMTGTDRLKFPAVVVEELIDNRMQTYVQGKDFNVDALGRITWLERNPGWDPDLDKGRVYTIVYRYRPYFYVERLGSDISVTQAEDEAGERRLFRLPFEATITREIFFETRNPADDGTRNREDAPGPADGSFGAQ